MKFAGRRSLWQGRGRRRPRRRLDPLRELLGPGVFGRPPAARRRAPPRIGLDDAERVEAAGDRRAVVEAPQERCRLVDRDPADLALDEARDQVALGLEEGDHLRPDPECGSRDRGRRARPARSIPSSAVSFPPIRSTNASPPARTLKLWFVIPPPSGSTESTPPGQTRSTTSVDHALMRSPRGSKSGSAATSPATQLAEDLDLDRLARPRELRPGGRRRRSSARPSSRSRRSSPGRPARRRPAPARSRARPRAGRRARGSRGAVRGSPAWRAAPRGRGSRPCRA